MTNFTPISGDVAAAVEKLQRRALRTTDTYELNRIERALDELLRSATREGSPDAMAKTAYGHAKQHYARQTHWRERNAMPPLPMPTTCAPNQHALELLLWLVRLSQRPTLREDVEVIVDSLSGASVDSVRLHRARAKIAKIWAA